MAGERRCATISALPVDQLSASSRCTIGPTFAGFGDKVTQRVWQEITAGGYVAQALVAPGQRSVEAGSDKPLKFDLRQYAYDGLVQWTAARVYQGQTTNFRTPGGGFAPVYEGPV